MKMKKLNTIQKRNKLNDVFGIETDSVTYNHHHFYSIYLGGLKPDEKINEEDIFNIRFQTGPRNEPHSIPGVLDTDLLEIVRDRLKYFQTTEFSCRENACALTHIEEALMWLNKRVEDRAEKEILGTNIADKEEE